MSETLPSPAERLDAAVAAYLEAVERGERPSREELLRSFGDIAGELTQFFADHDRMTRLAAPIKMSMSSTSRVRGAADETLALMSPTDLPATSSAESSRSVVGFRLGEY